MARNHNNIYLLFVFYLLNVILLFFSCKSVETKNEPSPNEPVAEMPEMIEGDTWTLHIKDIYNVKEDTIHEEVVRINSDGSFTVKIVSKRKDKPIYINYNNQYQIIKRGSVTTNTWLNFPLFIGKKWKFSQYSHSVGGGGYQYVFNCTVVKYETVKTKAGKFNAFRIEASYSASGYDLDSRSNISYWYSPEVKNIIKYSDINIWKELVDFRLTTKPQTSTQLADERAKLERQRQELERLKLEIERKRLEEEQKKNTLVASIDPKDREIGRDDHYIAYANGVVLDTKTGLEWLAGQDKDTSWGEAKKWIDILYSLSISGGKWRMPTINELKTLYEEGRGSRNMTPLLKTAGHLVWSGETIDSSSAWYFRFYQGSRSEDFYNTAYYKRAFAVRSRFSTEWQKRKNENERYTSSSSQVSKSKIIETDRHFIKYSNGTVKTSASLLVKKMQSGEVRFEGSITPVLIPINPEYKPGKFRYNDSGVLQTAEKTEEWSSEYTSAISEMGDLLIWEMATDELGFRLLTDRHGRIKEIEATTGFKEADEILQKIIKNTVFSIPDKVRTGDKYISVTFPGLPVIGELGDKHFYSILKGWSYYNGKKVLVTELNQKIKLREATLILNGYSLIDPETFQQIKGEGICDVEDSGHRVGRIYTLFTGSEIK